MQTGLAQFPCNILNRKLDNALNKSHLQHAQNSQGSSDYGKNLLILPFSKKKLVLTGHLLRPAKSPGRINTKYNPHSLTSWANGTSLQSGAREESEAGHNDIPDSLVSIRNPMAARNTWHARPYLKKKREMEVPLHFLHLPLMRKPWSILLSVSI